MKLALVEISNMLGIAEATIKPGQITLLSGKNGAGKSAVIDSIMAAFNAKGIEGELVTQGAEKGRVFIRLDDGHTIKASFDPSGKKSLAVTTPDGDVKKAPQTWLDGLMGSGVVNPVSFINMTTAEKRKMLLSALPIEVGADELKEWFGELPPVNTNQHGLLVLQEVGKYYYDQRREMNAKSKAIRAEIDVVAKDIPADFNAAEWEGLDTSVLTQQLQDIGRVEAEKRQKFADAAQTKQQADKTQQQVLGLDADNRSLRDKAESLKQQIADIEGRIQQNIVAAADLSGLVREYDSQAEQMQAEAEAIVVPDKSAIEQKLADYSQAQRVLQQIQNQKRLEAEFAVAKTKAGELDAKVEAARQKPKELLAQVELPVEGIEFTEDDIKVNGLSIDSLSDGEKLKLGVAIAKATTGQLGFICVDGAEKLDEENLRWLTEQADEDHIFVITMVGKGDLNIETLDTPAEAQNSLFGEEEK